MDRMELDHPLPHGADDPPAAGGGPAAIVAEQSTITHRGISLNAGTRRKSAQAGRWEKARLGGGEEGEGDDAHRLLRVVGAVAEAHEAALKSCALPKTAKPAAAWPGAAATVSSSMRSAPPAKPRSGDKSMGNTPWAKGPADHLSTPSRPRTCRGRLRTGRRSGRGWNWRAGRATR